ncbi:MAG: phage tail protein [Bacteroidia bacterium]
MKKALLLISTIATLQAQAQNLGVNTLTPHASSIMDITHTSRGLLIPRLPLVDVNDVTTIASPALSLLIFNTATAGIAPNDVKPGFYYFNGTKWVGIGTGSAWDLLGNAGTNSATNFLGTTDVQDLVFKTNSIENMRVRTNGRVSIGYADNTLYDFGHQLNVKDHMSLKRWGAAPNYVQTRYNGTEASPTAVLNGDWVGSLTFEASDGGANRPPVANIRILAKENVTATASGGDMAFYTTPIGTISPNERVRITENGYVGIGTTTPIARTHIYEPTGFAGTVNPLRIGLNVEIPPQSSNGYYIFKGSGGSLLAAGVVYGLGLDLNPTATTTGTRYGVYIENETQNYFSNNVGIGTAAPTNKLQITHGTAGNSGLRFTNLPNATALSTNASGDVIPTTLNPANALYWGLTGNSGTTPATNFVGTTDAQDLVFKTNSIENMRLTANGTLRNTIPTNIIGTDGQGENANSIIWGMNNAGYATGLYNASNVANANGLAVKTNGNAYSNIILDLSTGVDNVVGTSVMNVRGSGNVGIGTSTPLNTLHVKSNSGEIARFESTVNSSYLRFNNSGGNLGYIGWGGSLTDEVTISNEKVSATSHMYFFTNGAINPRMVIHSSGNVGVNISIPNTSAQLDVTSTTAGFAMPRMTSAQRKAIVAPIAGLDVYDLTLKGHYTFDGTKWDCSDNPAGSVNYFANATVPNGYLIANGQAVSRTTYAELFAAISTLYGAGDGSTTFNVPDLRGEFIRGVDNARGVDADVVRGVGSSQAGSLMWYDSGPSFTSSVINTAAATDILARTYVGLDKTTEAIWPNTNIVFTNSAVVGAATTTAGPTTHGGAAGDYGVVGTSRPRNVAMLPCIKF